MKEFFRTEQADFYLYLHNLFYSEKNQDELFQNILELILSFMEDSAFCSGRIRINGKYYLSENFRVTDKYHRATIYVDSEITGEINIFVSEKSSLNQSDYNMIKTVAMRLGDFLQNKNEYNILKKINYAVDNIDKGVLITDENKVIIFSNRKLNEITDFSQDEISGKTLDYFLEKIIDFEKRKILYSNISDNGKYTDKLLINDRFLLINAYYMRNPDSRNDSVIILFEEPDLCELPEETENSHLLTERDQIIKCINIFLEIFEELAECNMNLCDFIDISRIRTDISFLSGLLSGDNVIHEDDHSLCSILDNIKCIHGDFYLNGDKYLLGSFFDILCKLKEKDRLEIDIVSGKIMNIRIDLSGYDLIVKLLSVYSWLNGFDMIEHEGNIFHFDIKIKPSDLMNNERKNISVLFVEDNNASFKLSELFLKKYGISDISRAVNGKDGIELFMKNSFDIVFMDIHMEGISGLEATIRIREYESEHRQGRRIPIIANSAFLDENEIHKCIESGCDDFLVKPIDNESIISIIEKWVK